MKNMSRTILITGGSGFIGTKIIEMLLASENTFKIICIGPINRLPEHLKDQVTFYLEYIQPDILNRIFSEHDITHVFHLAASIFVDDGEKDPISYYQNNICPLIYILDAMKYFKCKNIVFSSTAAVYGKYRGCVPFVETDAGSPQSVYGRSKYYSERILQDVCSVENINYFIFRFFNVAGGKDQSDVPKHLIPVLVDRIQNDQEVTIFGTDYDTVDGSCVRDYIHVEDIARAFLLAIQKFADDDKCEHLMNLGSRNGYSVKQIIDATFNVLGKKVNVVESARRDGDTPFNLADSSLAEQILGWKPQMTLEDIIRDCNVD